MVELEYNDVKIKVPDSWDDITLGKYEYFYKQKPETHRERVALVAYACDVAPELLLEWPTAIFNRILGYVDFIFGGNPIAPNPVITINGVIYAVPIEDELSLGAYIDADELQRSEANNISGLLAIVCRPVGEKYNFKNNDERQKMFAALPVIEVFGLLAFFLQVCTAYNLRTQVYSNLQNLADLLPRNIWSLLKRGTGIKLYRIWQVMTYYASIASLNYQLRKFSPSYSIRRIRTAQKKRKGN